MSQLYAEPDTEGHLLYDFISMKIHKTFRKGQSMKTESGFVVARPEEKGEWGEAASWAGGFGVLAWLSGLSV